jgi:hypothetical protein
MKKMFTSHRILTAILAVFVLSLQAQTPGTFPGGGNPGGGNPPSSGGLTQIYSSTGHYTLSSDGIGSLSSSMVIRVNKPTATATVAKAILMSAVTDDVSTNGCVTLAASPITWNGAANVTVFPGFYFNNYWADVTSIVSAAINPLGAGISTLAVTECNTSTTEGEALLVIFNDASAPERTIVIMWGGQNPAGDNFAITLGTPIDPLASGALLDMGVGIGFSYQISDQQYSIIDVNSQRLTTSAGGEDDGGSADGMLITVGGIGDSDANPPNPNSLPNFNIRYDDELYSLLPFITNTTTSINVLTSNPSLNDDIFLSYFVLSGAAIIGEGILLTQTTTSGPVGGNHTVQALVQDATATPIVNRLVTFTVTSGPNAGATGSANTNGSGLAFFTYPDSGGPGTDQIQGCFVNSQSATVCSNILSFDWIPQTNNTIPTLSQWGMIILGFILLIVSSLYIIRKRIGISG